MASLVDEPASSSTLYEASAIPTADGLVTPHAEVPPTSAVEADAEASPAPALHQLFTLPFALHLRPLPQLSYGVVQRSDEDTSSSSSHSSNESDVDSVNLGPGSLRLKAYQQASPPHSLQDVSRLLAQTQALQAIKIWSSLILLLHEADEDASFANLRAFFEARFDADGALVGVGGGEAGKSPKGGAWGVGRKSRKGEALSPGRRPSTTQSQRPNRSRTFSSSAASAHGTRRNRLVLFGRTLGRDDGESEEEEEGEIRAPELRLPPNPTASPRPGVQDGVVRFNVRLDLHSVNLAPAPPPPKVRRQKGPTLDLRNLPAATASEMQMLSPGSVFSGGGGGGGDDLGRVRSNSSMGAAGGGGGLLGGSTLEPVASPDSVHSWRGGMPSSPGRASSPMFKRSGLGKRNPSSSSGVANKGVGQRSASRDAATSSSLTLDSDVMLGTSPDTSEAPLSMSSANGSRGGAAAGQLGRERSRKSALGRNGSKNDGGRRPSMIQRFLEFGKAGRRGSAASSFDTTGSSTDALPESAEAAIPEHPAGAAASSEGLAPPHRGLALWNSRGAGSDQDNEEALDIADDEASISSSLPSRFSSVGGGRRRASSSSAISASLGTTGLMVPPELQPVAEGLALEAPPPDAAFGALEEDEPVDRRTWTPGQDFLALLRQASEVALNVPPASTSPPADGIDKGKTPESGSHTPSLSSSSGHATPSSARAPPSSAHWWLSGADDPLTLSIPCAFADALGWEGIMDLCYGEGSRCAKEEDFGPLGKAAEMDERQQSDTALVKRWARQVQSTTLSADDGGGERRGAEDAQPPPPMVEEMEAFSFGMPTPALRDGSEHGASELAPSESASAAAAAASANAAQQTTSALLDKIKKVLPIPGRSASVSTGANEALAPAELLAPLQLHARKRTWADWAALMSCIAKWVEAYETTRVRAGLAKEMLDEHNGGITQSSSGFSVAAKEGDETLLASPMGSSWAHDEPLIHACVATDALNRTAGFRRREGIPDGLASGKEGDEHHEYTWASSRLGPKHFATALTIGADSLAHLTAQLDTSNWVHRSAWELDYLEACVFHSPIVAERFPPPGTIVVPPSLSFHPVGEEQSARAQCCPYPSAEGAWDAKNWKKWLAGLQHGQIVTPAVSWQAWWFIISVLNGGDGTGRPIDLQVKSPEEPYALDEWGSILI